MEKKTKIIGLTGGIGSGKTTVSKYLQSLGFCVLDADQISREAVEPGQPALEELAALFGTWILTADGRLDRRKMADLIFADASKKKAADEIIHSKVAQALRQAAESFQGELLFMDIPLLFEAGWDIYMDEVWLVDAEEELQISRTMARDAVDRKSVERRMDNQMGRLEKRKRAQRILDNSGEKEDLYRKVDGFLKQIQEKDGCQ